AIAPPAEQAGVRYVPRSGAQVEGLLDGLELVEPGLVPIPAWNPLHLDYPGAADVARDPDSVSLWVPRVCRSRAWTPLPLADPGAAEVDRAPYSVYGWAAVARKP